MTLPPLCVVRLMCRRYQRVHDGCARCWHSHHDPGLPSPDAGSLSPLPPPPSGGLGTISGNSSVSVTQQPVGRPLMWNLYKRRIIKFYRQILHLSQTNLVFIISSESKLNPILSNFWCIYLYSSFQLVGSGMFGEDEIILVCCETDSSEGHLIQI